MYRASIQRVDLEAVHPGQWLSSGDGARWMATAAPPLFDEWSRRGWAAAEYSQPAWDGEMLLVGAALT